MTEVKLHKFKVYLVLLTPKCIHLPDFTVLCLLTWADTPEPALLVRMANLVSQKRIVQVHVCSPNVIWLHQE